MLQSEHWMSNFISEKYFIFAWEKMTKTLHVCVRIHKILKEAFSLFQLGLLLFQMLKKFYFIFSNGNSWLHPSSCAFCLWRYKRQHSISISVHIFLKSKCFNNKHECFWLLAKMNYKWSECWHIKIHMIKASNFCFLLILDLWL